MAMQTVDVTDFPGMTLDDALKIGTHRLTQQGYAGIEPLSDQPRQSEDGRWRLTFRVAGPNSATDR